MKQMIFAALLTITLLLCGCQTTYQARNNMRSNEDRLMEQENQRRMAGRIETLEMEISRMGGDLDRLRAQLDSRCAAIERKSEADKKETISRLTSQLEQLLKKSAPAPAASAPAASQGYGYEHTVRPGETLSTIAAAYGASVKRVISANKLKNPDRLKVGQKLFIPE